MLQRINHNVLCTLSRRVLLDCWNSFQERITLLWTLLWQQKRVQRRSILIGAGLRQFNLGLLNLHRLRQIREINSKETN
jgi:hypothetical protein